MEILVRRSDLVKELHLEQGIVERKNSIPSRSKGRDWRSAAC